MSNSLSNNTVYVTSVSEFSVPSVSVIQCTQQHRLKETEIIAFTFGKREDFFSLSEEQGGVGRGERHRRAAWGVVGERRGAASESEEGEGERGLRNWSGKERGPFRKNAVATSFMGHREYLLFSHTSTAIYML